MTLKRTEGAMNTSQGHLTLSEVRLYQTMNLLQFAEIIHETEPLAGFEAINLLQNLSHRSASHLFTAKTAIVDERAWVNFESCYVTNKANIDDNDN